MDYDSETIFPRNKTGRDSNIRNMFDKGKVIEICNDDSRVSVRVQILDKDGFITKPIPVKQPGSKSNQSFWCPDVGDDVSVCFPPNAENGDGFVDGSFYNTGNPPPPNPLDVNEKGEPQPLNHRTKHVTYKDGSYMQFDPNKSKTTVNTKGPVDITTSGTVTITAGRIVIIGEVEIQGNVSIKGNLDVQGDVSNSGNMTTGGTHTDSAGKHC